MPFRVCRPRSFLLPALLLVLGTVSLTAATTFRVALPGTDPGSLAPGRLGTPLLRPLTLALADTLVSFDGATGFPRPGLAESWTVGDDGVTWTFTLRTSRWSDGTALTSRDVLDSWTRAGRVPSLEARGNRIAVLSAPDPRHLTVTFTRPLDSPALLGSPDLGIWSGDGLRFSGPFQVEAREAGRSLTLARNPGWREAASVNLDRIVFHFAGTSQEAVRLYREGLADWVPHGGGPGTAADPAWKDAVAAPGWGTVFLRLNLSEPPLSDPVFRRALAANVEASALAKDLRGPLLVPWAGFVPRTSPAPAARPAQKLLLPVYKPGTPLTILYAAGETNGRIARRLADHWNRSLGLKVETKEASFAQVQADRASGAYQVALGGWLGDYPDPLAFLEILLPGRGNDTRYEDPVFGELLAGVREAVPGKDRDRRLAEAEARLLEEVPVIPLLAFAAVNQIDLRKWTGWTPNPTDLHPWPGISRAVAPKPKK